MYGLVKYLIPQEYRNPHAKWESLSKYNILHVKWESVLGWDNNTETSMVTTQYSYALGYCQYLLREIWSKLNDLCQFFFMEPIVPCSKPQYGAEFSTFMNGAVSNKNYIRSSQKLKDKPANSQEAHPLKSKLLCLSEYLRGRAHLQQL